MTSSRENQGLGVKHNIPISLELNIVQIERHHSKKMEEGGTNNV